MDRDAASRIQSAACRDNDGKTPKDSFAARAMSAAYTNHPHPNNQPRQGKNQTLFQPSNASSSSDTNSESSSSGVKLAIGAAALIAGGALAYAAYKGNEEENKKDDKDRSEPEPSCTIM